MPVSPRWFLLAGLAALAACSGPVIYPPDLGSYSPAFPSWAAKNGVLQIEVHGRPFGDAVPPAAIAEAAELPSWLRARPVAAPHPQAPEGYRVVLVFSPARNLAGASLCTGDTPTRATAPGSPIEAVAAFCAYDRSFALAAGRGPAMQGSADPAFRLFTAHLFDTLLPPVHPDQYPDKCTPPDC